MPARSDASDVMWARAVELLDEADRLHRRFFHLSTAGRTAAAWEPPADVYEDGRDIVIVVAMPGVRAERVQVISEPGALVVRGTRTLPFSGSGHHIRQLEIPYGTFERRISLPPGTFRLDPPEVVDGCLVLRLNR
jgi:HSP20 family protein